MADRRKPTTAARSQAAAKPPQAPATYSLHFEFMLPAWELTGPAPEERSAEFELWIDLGRKIKGTKPHLAACPTGRLILDATVPAAADSPGEFPPVFTPRLIEDLRGTLPAILEQAGPPIQLFRRMLADFGEIVFTASFEPVAADFAVQETVALPLDLPHSGPVGATGQAEKGMGEGATDRYEQQANVLEEQLHRFRQSLAQELAPTLNARMQATPHGTYEEKKDLAKWVNEELRRFDLAIKCPKTGQPSILLVGTGNHPEIGRFEIEHRNSEGKRVRAVCTPKLLDIELMEANPRREALKEWRERIEQQRRGEAARG